MKILVKKIDGLQLPNRANADDAGFDIFAASDPNIVGKKISRPVDGILGWTKIDYIEYKTNLCVAPQDEVVVNNKGFREALKFHTLLFPRSSISKKNLVLANSVPVIDTGYRGEILLRFKYIIQPEDLFIAPEFGIQKFYCALSPDNIYKKGDRICQMQAHPNVDIEFQLVEQLEATVRGEGKFGSTGD